MTSSRGVGIRTQILAILLGTAIVPLGLVGLWLTSTAVRSGESLLRSHLVESADRFVAATQARWEYRQADIALIAGNEASVRVAARAPLTGADSTFLSTLSSSLARTIPTIELRDRDGRLRWSSTPQSRAAAEARTRGQDSAAATPAARAATTLRVESAIQDSLGRNVGTAITDVALAALIPPDSARPLVPGAKLGVRNWSTGTVSIVLDPAVPFPAGDRVTIAGETWLATRRRLANPTIEVVIAAPRTGYVAPFKRAALVGVIALIAVSALSIVLTVVLARRIAHPLEELALASDAVTAGKLDQRVGVRGPAEVRRVGAGFNVMTENLRATLDALARRSALAAVGEFATSLSHDVRNALTSIRVDLDRLSMRDVPDPVATTLIARALNSVAKLEASVAGALRVARRGNAAPTDVDLSATIRTAADVVRGTFASIPAELRLELPEEPIVVRGDQAALQQLFANLLFNAAQALGPGGAACVAASTGSDTADLVVSDTGAGISPDAMAKLETPFFSTKPNGTGLGLPIARQIVAAHNGTLAIDSVEGQGTTVRLRLPVGTKRSPGLNEAISETAAAP